MNLALHLALALDVLLVIVDGIIQGVFELIEARKHRHDGIEMERSTVGLNWEDVLSALGVPVMIWMESGSEAEP